MKRNRVREVINKIFFEHVCEKEEYYRKKILSNQPLKDIIQESLMHEDVSILKRLILKEFPHHKEFLFKYMIIQ